MSYLLDANVCIVHLRTAGQGPVTTRLISVDPSDVLVCSVVVAELLFGVLRGRNVAKNRVEVNTFLAGFRSLPFDDAAAERHAEIRTQLASRGTLIGPHDLMIAAIALANDLTLVTHNTSEFARVPGLKLEDWQTP